MQEGAMQEGAMQDDMEVSGRLEALEGELERAELETDPERLRVLEEVYESLDAELERDVEQASPPRR